MLQNVYRGVYASPLLTISCLEGETLGSGCMIPLACDYRFMTSTKDSVFGLNEVAYGLHPSQWCFERLKDLVGTAKATRMATWGLTSNAAECLERGIVDALFPTKEELQEAAMAFLSTRLESTSTQHGPIKTMLREEDVSLFDAQNEEEAEWMVEFWSKPEIKLEIRKRLYPK